ncbi:hypothetical protein Tco_1300276 [Tanacetum coccineum]
MENRMNKGKCHISRTDECFLEVKRKKSGAINGGNKHFKSVSVKLKLSIGLKLSNRLQGWLALNKESPSNKSNGSFSISNSFEVLNVDSLINEEVATGSKGTTSDKLVLMDDDGKPSEKVDYSANSDNDDGVEPVENKNVTPPNFTAAED